MLFNRDLKLRFCAFEFLLKHGNNSLTVDGGSRSGRVAYLHFAFFCVRGTYYFVNLFWRKLLGYALVYVELPSKCDNKMPHCIDANAAPYLLLGNLNNNTGQTLGVSWLLTIFVSLKKTASSPGKMQFFETSRCCMLEEDIEGSNKLKILH